MASIQVGEAPPHMDTKQPVLSKGSALTGHVEPESGHVGLGWYVCRGMDLKTVQMIWEVFRKVLSASEDSSHCPIFFSKGTERLYAFLLTALLPQIIRRVREDRCSVLLVAPLWRNQSWLAELVQLLSAAPWLIPLRKDQVEGAIWDSQPELCSLQLCLCSFL